MDGGKGTRERNRGSGRRKGEHGTWMGDGIRGRGRRKGKRGCGKWNRGRENKGSDGGRGKWD